MRLDGAKQRSDERGDGVGRFKVRPITDLFTDPITDPLMLNCRLLSLAHEHQGKPGLRRFYDGRLKPVSIHAVPHALDSGTDILHHLHPVHETKEKWILRTADATEILDLEAGDEAAGIQELHTVMEDVNSTAVGNRNW